MVVLQKKEEEAFGFEIQVRGLTAVRGRDLTTLAPFFFFLTGFPLATSPLTDDDTEATERLLIRMFACAGGGRKVTHQSDKR